MAIAIVNSVAYEPGGSGANYNITAQNHTSGNNIYVCVSHYTTTPPNVSGITDTAGNTYALVGTRQSGDGSANHKTELWAAHNITGNATNVINVSYGATSCSFRNAHVWQVSGALTSSSYDTESTGLVTTSGTTHTSNSLTTAAENEMLLMQAVAWDPPGNTSASSPTVKDGAAPGGGLDDIAGFHRPCTTTGSYTAVMTTADNRSYWIRTWAIKESVTNMFIPWISDGEES